jgi:hypothetical protein
LNYEHCDKFDGVLAEVILREVLSEQPSAEVRRRANALLLKLKSSEVSPELVVAVRTLEVLERAATPEARRLLQTLADGAPGARLTKEAQAVMNRMPIAQRRE